MSDERSTYHCCLNAAHILPNGGGGAEREAEMLIIRVGLYRASECFILPWLESKLKAHVLSMAPLCVLFLIDTCSPVCAVSINY